MNFILHGSKHTVLASVFDSFEGREKEFNWLITDMEIVAHPNLSEIILKCRIQ